MGDVCGRGSAVLDQSENHPDHQPAVARCQTLTTSQQLRCSEKVRLMEAALAYMSDGVYILDEQLRFALSNDRYRELLRMPAALVGPGCPVEPAVRYLARRGDYGPGEQEDVVRQRMQAYVERVAYCLELRTPEGRYIEFRQNPIHGGGIVVTCRDVTDRRSAEVAMRAAHTKMVEGLNYAQMIQNNVLPKARQLEARIPDHFVMWRPRDVVSGDFFFFHDEGKQFLLGLADCTGHGVPGAFMTMTAHVVLSQLVSEMGPEDPAGLLMIGNRLLRAQLHQGPSDKGGVDNGLDLGLVYCDLDERKLVFAGARIGLIHAGRHGAVELRGQRQSLGYRRSDLQATFTNHVIEVESGDAFYMTSDGLLDQAGGSAGMPFGRRRLQDFVEWGYRRSMAEQGKALEERLALWQGDNPQRDDITVIGFRLDRD
jgi:serine phosphatase RsbU (regulator of sigma subunit)